MLTIALAASALAQPYKLVFHDEFDRGSKPNPQAWRYEHGFVRNRELQWYQEDNARIGHGTLIIEARRERVKNPNFVPGESSLVEGPASKPRENWKVDREYAEFTSSSLRTVKGLEWTFGKFEMRAKFDADSGCWPAFWSVGTTRTWPLNGEIDIFEFYQRTILANAAWGSGTWDDSKTPLSHWLEKQSDWLTKFHVWRMEWDQNVIRLFLDNEELNSIDLTKTLNPDGANPFHEPHDLILNLAIGSTGGDPSQTTFPRRFVIDYVRVYQRSD